LQQKIAFEDRACVIPRVMPFSIDLDAQFIDWSEEERALLLGDAEYARYGMGCRVPYIAALTEVIGGLG
jgi:hypothetical protein